MISRARKGRADNSITNDVPVLLNEVGLGFLVLFAPALDLTLHRRLFSQSQLKTQPRNPKKIVFNNLPPEVKEIIFSYLPPLELIRIKEVSSGFHQLINQSLDRQESFFHPGGYQHENAYLIQRCRQIRRQIKTLEPTSGEKRSYFFLPPLHGVHRRHLENEREGRVRLKVALSLVAIAITTVVILSIFSPLAVALIAGILAFSAFSSGVLTNISDASVGVAYPKILKSAKRCEQKKIAQLKLKDELSFYQHLRLDRIEERQQSRLSHSFFSSKYSGPESLTKESIKLTAS